MNRRLRFVSGYAVWRRLEMTSARDATWSMLAPLGSRPTMLNPLERRRSKIPE